MSIRICAIAVCLVSSPVLAQDGPATASSRVNGYYNAQGVYMVPQGRPSVVNRGAPGARPSAAPRVPGAAGLDRKLDWIVSDTPVPPGYWADVPPPPPVPYAPPDTQATVVAERPIEKTEAEKRREERVRESKRLESLKLAEQGMAFYRRGEFLSAASQYGWAIDRDPTNPKLHYCRAIMFNRLGRFEEAIPELVEAIQLDPDFKEAQQALDYAMGKKPAPAR